MGNGVLYQEIGTNTLILSGDTTNFGGGVEVNKGIMVVSNLLVSDQGALVDFGSTLSVQGILGGGGVTNSSGGTSGGLVTGSGVVSNVLDNFGTIYPSGGGSPATLTVDGSLVLDSSSSDNISFTLNNANTIGGGMNDLIAVNGNLVINSGTVTVNLNPLGILQDGVPYTIISYTGSLTMNGTFSVAPVDGYTFTVSTSTPGKINIVASGGPPIWTGDSATDSDWSDNANWSVPPSSGLTLFFQGDNRLTNTNDISGGSYTGIEFTPGAGAFVLDGTNALTIDGTIINDSATTETVNAPITLNSTGPTFNGSSGTLVVSGGITNTSGGDLYLTFMGSGIVNDLINCTGTTATNLISITGANTVWTMLDNPSSTPVSSPSVLAITNGTLVFGSATSAPNFTSTSQQGAPQDNQVGYGAGAATFMVSNGTYTTSARLNTGPVAGATGIVDVVNGTLSVASMFQGANGALTSGGQLNVSGGIFTTPGTLFVSSRGIAFLNLSGTGSVTCAALDVSRNAADGGSGTVNLNGGILNCSSVATETANNEGGGAPTATFNFNGGTLKATASSATYYQGALSGPACPVNTFIMAGGAYLNDGGFSIGVNEPFQSGVGHDGGLTKLGAGTVTFNKTNTYNGSTIISAGTLALGATGSMGTNTAPIIIAGGATFSVSALPSAFSLASSRLLTNSSPTAAILGNVNASAGALGLTYAAGTPSLSIGSGTLTLAAATGLTINNTSATPLPVGIYTIVSNATGGLVAGILPTSFTVTGGGTQAGQPTVLEFASGALDLVVGNPAQAAYITGVTISGLTLTITATNGAPNGQYTLLESTNLLLPISQWTPVLTNNFTGSGNLNLSTNVVTPGNPQMFYLLQMP